jgi:hypothetical protein
MRLANARFLGADKREIVHESKKGEIQAVPICSKASKLMQNLV